MPFRPNVNDELTINGERYRIAEHLAAPGMPLGSQTGLVVRGMRPWRCIGWCSGWSRKYTRHELGCRLGHGRGSCECHHCRRSDLAAASHACQC